MAAALRKIKVSRPTWLTIPGILQREKISRTCRQIGHLSRSSEFGKEEILKSGAPDRDKQRCNDIASITTAAAEGQSDDRKKYKVCSASKTGDLIEFKT